MNHLRGMGALAVGLSAYTALAIAQSTSGNIAGVVYDPSGATVPGASISVKNEATGIESAARSTSSGQFRFENLLVGSYRLSVSATGFNRVERTGIRVPLNQTVTSNVALQVEKASTTVEVSAAAAAIDTTTAQIESTFEGRQIQDLPVTAVGAGVLNLSLLNAGVSSSSGLGFGVGPSVGGQRPANNSFTIEGVDNNDKGTTGPLVTVPNDAVAQFTVLQNQFSPEFGHSSGGQFNQIIKSGTNEFHGLLYEYFQNRNLDAADNQSVVARSELHPRFDRNRFGGNLGGPLKKNKMFFFVNWEYFPIGQSSSTFYYVPTQAGYDALASIGGISQTNLSVLKKYMGTAAAASPSSSLPSGRPVSVDGVTVPVGKVAGGLPNWQNNQTGVASFDYSISDKDFVRARYVFNRISQVDHQGFPSQFFGIRQTNLYLATLSEYHTFTPSLTNEFRLGFNRSNDSIPVPGSETFPGLDQFPNISIYELGLSFGPDPSAPQFSVQNTYQLTDNVSWTRGAHSLKFGFDGQKAIAPSSFTQRSRGDYEWIYLNEYLSDISPDAVAERGLGNVVYYGDQVLLSFYGNDTWKIWPNLTLNLGLRYEYQTVPYSERLQTVNALASVPGLISFTEPKPQKTNFMPRVGIAYSPGTSGKTSIRAGFGINYDVVYDNLGTLSLPPQFSTNVDASGLGRPGFLAGGGILPNTTVGALTPSQARFLTQGYIPDQKRPQSIQWNFGIQHVFAQDYTAEVRYLGTRGLFLPLQVQLNRQAVVTPANALPVYWSMPSQAALDSLSNTLTPLQTAFKNGGDLVPSYPAAGFNNPGSPITAFMPIGSSTYHGLATQLTRRFSHSVQFLGSYTWSHNIDDSTAAVSSTVFAPRRPQDSQNLRSEKSSSMLDHRNRLSAALVYEMPVFKNRSWLLKNLLGNWEIAPVYIYQTGSLVTPQSQADANLNGDSASDRVFLNPLGDPALGSGTRPLRNTAGQTVAYLATNPAARYVSAPAGTLPDGGRSLLNLNPINDVDVTLAKRFTLGERYRVEVAARAFNIFNHPQYTGGFLDDVLASPYPPNSASGVLARSSFDPQSNLFSQWDQVFSSNPRALTLSLKLSF
jgi:Carboxypeptidase regulatory-like domain